MSAALEQRDWLVLEWLEYALAVPREQVERIESASGLRAALPHEAAAAWLDDGRDPVPVYCLDHSMRPCTSRSNQGFVLLCTHRERRWGLLGDKVTIVTPPNLPRPVPLPAIHRGRQSPVEGLAVDETGKLVLLTGTARLGAWLFAHRRRADAA